MGFKVYNARKHGERLVGWQAYVPFMKTPSSSTTNYPTPRSAGPLEWIKDKIDGLRNKRSQTGGFEDSRLEGQYQGLNAGATGGARGRGRFEDDTWNSQVGGRDEDPYGPGPGGYHEEQELGLSTPGHARNESTPGPYGGGDYMTASTGYAGASHGRDRVLEADPFSDAHQAPSLRSVSPRPESGVDASKRHKRGDTLGSDDGVGNTSPISTRKSVFREDVS